MCPRKHVLCFHVIQPSVSGYYPPATKHNGIIEAILWWKGVTPWDEELPSVLLSSFNEVLVETSSIAAQLKVGCEMVWKEFGSTWLGEMEWEKQWKVSKEKEGKVREGETSERWWCEERLQVWAVNAKAESRGNLGENLPCGWGWWTRRSRRTWMDLPYLAKTIVSGLDEQLCERHTNSVPCMAIKQSQTLGRRKTSVLCC